jgi:hypothetical protein
MTSVEDVDVKFSVVICELVDCTMKTPGFFSNMFLGVNILQDGKVQMYNFNM